MSEPRVFAANTLQEALALVKRELGPEAVILGTRHVESSGLAGAFGRGRVEITAAISAHDAAVARGVRSREAGAPRAATAQRIQASGSVETPPRATNAGPPTSLTRENRASADPPALPEAAYPYYLELVKNEVAEQLAARLARHIALDADAARDRNVAARRLREALAAMLPATGGISPVPGQRRTLALVGPPGVGKTTTLAKLAAHYHLRKGVNVAVLSLDMHRLATHDQVRRYCALIGVPFERAQTVSRLKQAQKSLACELLLIDTPGVSLRDRGRFVRLAALLRAARADEVHLVLPASQDANVQERNARYFAALGVSRLALTHLDELIGMGVVLNAADRLRLTLSYTCDGQSVPKDLNEACVESVATLVCPALL